MNSLLSWPNDRDMMSEECVATSFLLLNEATKEKQQKQAQADDSLSAPRADTKNQKPKTQPTCSRWEEKPKTKNLA